MNTISFLWILSGAVLSAVIMIFVMRRYMIVAYHMDASYDTVCNNIETAIKSVPGWGHPIQDWDFHAAVNKTHYFNNLKNKRIFFICKAEYANSIVDKFHHMGAMMPCAWAVYETTKGKVYISKMNIALMSKMFIGNVIGSTMAKVGQEEHQMLNELRRLISKSKQASVA